MYNLVMGWKHVERSLKVSSIDDWILDRMYQIKNGLFQAT